MEDAAIDTAQSWEQNAWDQRTLEWLAAQIDTSSLVQVHSLVGEALHSPQLQHLAPKDWWGRLVQASPFTATELPPALDGVSLSWQIIRQLRNGSNRADLLKLRLSNLSSVMSQLAPITTADWLTGTVIGLSRPLAGGDIDLTQWNSDVWGAAPMVSRNPTLPELDTFAYPGSLLSPYQLLAEESLKTNLGSDYQMSVAVNLAGNTGVSSQQLTWFMDLLERKVPRVQGEFDSPDGLGLFFARVLAEFNNNPNYVPHYAVESVRSSEPWILERGAAETGFKKLLAVAEDKEATGVALLDEPGFAESLPELATSVREAMRVAQGDREAIKELEFAARHSFLIGFVFAELEKEMDVTAGSLPLQWLAELL